MTFRITYMTIPHGGTPVYCRVDVVTPSEIKLAGMLTLDPREFDEFRRQFKDVKTVEFVPHTWEEIRQNQPIEDRR